MYALLVFGVVMFSIDFLALFGFYQDQDEWKAFTPAMRFLYIFK